MAALLLVVLCAVVPASSAQAVTHHRPVHAGATLLAGVDQPGGPLRSADQQPVVAADAPAAAASTGTVETADTVVAAVSHVAGTSPARGPPGPAA